MQPVLGVDTLLSTASGTGAPDNNHGRKRRWYVDTVLLPRVSSRQCACCACHPCPPFLPQVKLVRTLCTGFAVLGFVATPARSALQMACLQHKDRGLVCTCSLLSRQPHQSHHRHLVSRDNHWMSSELHWTARHQPPKGASGILLLALTCMFLMRRSILGGTTIETTATTMTQLAQLAHQLEKQSCLVAKSPFDKVIRGSSLFCECALSI